MAKKILAVLFAFSMFIMPLGGCSSSDDKTPQEPSQETKVNDASDNADDSGEKIKFVFAEHIADVENQAPQVWGVVQAYMKEHPNVEIEIQGTDINEHINKTKMAAQSDSLPDLFYIKTGVAREMIEAGQIADITDDIMADQSFAEGFLDGMTDVLEVDGRIYGLPCEVQANGIWYNKKLFEQCGLEIPETYEELLNVCKVFRENGIIPMARGAKDTYSVWALTNMFCRFGFFDHIDAVLAGEEKWNNPDYLKFYEKLREMTELGMWPDNVSSIGYWEATELFMGEQAAMLDSGVWDTKKFDSSELKEYIYFDWGPVFDDGVGTQEISMKAASFPYCVSAKLKEEDPQKYAVVIDFLKFYYGSSGTKIIVEDNQCVPVTKYQGTVDSAAYPVFARVMEKMNDNWQSPVLAPNFYIPGDLEASYHDSITGVINGVYTPEEACDFMDNQMQAIGLFD